MVLNTVLQILCSNLPSENEVLYSASQFGDEIVEFGVEGTRLLHLSVQLGDLVERTDDFLEVSLAVILLFVLAVQSESHS